MSLTVLETSVSSGPATAATRAPMWTGWQSFPMVFVKGVFVGGAEDLGRLIASGEIKAMMKAKRPKHPAQR